MTIKDDLKYANGSIELLKRGISRVGKDERIMLTCGWQYYITQIIYSGDGQKLFLAEMSNTRMLGMMACSRMLNHLQNTTFVGFVTIREQSPYMGYCVIRVITPDSAPRNIKSALEKHCLDKVLTAAPDAKMYMWQNPKTNIQER